MKLRVFIDTNVFIYAFEFQNSNSAKVIELLNEGEIEATISEQVLKEVTRYFEKFHSTILSKKFRRYLFDNCVIVKKEELNLQITDLKGKIKEKDIEQLAATKKYGIKFLISYDRDFEGFEEYVTPKQFLRTLNKEVSESEF